MDGDAPFLEFIAQLFEVGGDVEGLLASRSLCRDLAQDDGILLRKDLRMQESENDYTVHPKFRIKMRIIVSRPKTRLENVGAQAHCRPDFVG